jgi:hypothetical protein
MKMPSTPRSDRFLAIVLFLVTGGIALLILGQCGPPVRAFADDLSPVTQYSTLELPVSNLGFRGIAQDKNGSLFVSSSLADRIYVLPPGCRNESCASPISLKPSLGLPGEVVADPFRGGAYLLLRLGDRVDYLPPHCLSETCLQTLILPERPAYPFRAVYDDQRRALAVLDRLSKKVVFIPEGCVNVHCLTRISLPKHGQPSGIAYDRKRGDLWVTFYRTGSLLKIPAHCPKLSCSVVFPSTISGLNPESPVISSSSDRLYLVLKNGSAIGWVDLGQSRQSLEMRSIEPTSGKIIRLSPLHSGGVFLVTGGEYPHAGFFTAGPSCPEGCFDVRLLPFRNGSPYGLSSGRKDSFWMTIDDRDALFRISSRPECREKQTSGEVLSKNCLEKIAFQKIETLYHSRYHQEIQVPSEPSTKLSDPSD